MSNTGLKFSCIILTRFRIKIILASFSIFWKNTDWSNLFPQWLIEFTKETN